MERAAPMIQYVRKSTILTALAVNDGGSWCSEDRVCLVMAGHFFQAVLDNYQQQLKNGNICNIEKLEIQNYAYIENSREIFANILRTCSSLRHLTIDLVDGIVNWNWLTQALGSNTSLEHVYINSEGEKFIGSRIVANIIWSLSQHPRLQTMVLPYVADRDREEDRGWRNVVKAVKKNGSLHKVSWPKRSWLPAPWWPRRVDKPGRRTRRYLKAIGRRNRLTPKLLANPRLGDHRDGLDDDAAESTTTDTKQFPTLFMASLDAERTAPHMLLTGLLSTLDIFGHHGNGKRLRDM